jgi:hypothetical protein
MLFFCFFLLWDLLWDFFAGFSRFALTPGSKRLRTACLLCFASLLRCLASLLRSFGF